MKRKQLSGWQLLFWLFLTLMIRNAILTLFLLLIIAFLYAPQVYKEIVKHGLQVVFSKALSTPEFDGAKIFRKRKL
jgi:hypothetical protein